MNPQNIVRPRQHGGTLLGLVIGLVIGLGIAVAVALLITKSSTPFTNKNAKADKTDSPIEQMQDPNKPLYGNKELVKDAAKDLVRATDSSKAAEATTANTTAAVAKLDPNSAAVAGGVSPDKANAKPGEVVPKTEVVENNYVYFLQTGAFREQADAESARAKLALIGFEASISEKPSDSGTLYRVRIGPFNQIETMNRMRAKLSENSVDVAVVRTTK